MTNAFLSTKLSTNEANTGKINLLSDFINEYRIAIAFYVEYLWNTYDIDTQNYDIPKFIESEIKPATTELSARALKCAATQASGMVRSRVNKLGKMQFKMRELQSKGTPNTKLQSKYDKLVYKLRKPKINMVLPELNSICCVLEDSKLEYFDAVFTLFSIGKKYGKIIIPVKKTKHFNELKSLGIEKASFLVNHTGIHARFEISVDKKTDGTTEGADQGASTCVTLSDGQVTIKDVHGHDLHSIMTAMKRKKKGSKSFKKAQAHRKNYINWSINQLNLSGIKKINLEKLKYMGKGQKKNRFLQAFSYKEIRIALEKVCLLAGVQLVETSNAYRSQRCSQCGFVHKSNRRGKLFRCKDCSHAMDADLNAAMNHKVKLFDLPVRNVNLPNKSSGFYWKSTGLFDVDGSALTVPVA